VLVPWIRLSPSRREQDLRRLAQVLSALSALALLGASFPHGEVEPAPLLGALLAAVAAAVAARARPTPLLDVGVDDAGALVVRAPNDGDGGPEHRLPCVFAAPWLITLRRGTMWVRIWPDSLPGNAFRRFWVHIRWNPGRQPAGRTAATAPVRSG
jgi:hypothetical protein